MDKYVKTPRRKIYECVCRVLHIGGWTSGIGDIERES